MIRTIERIKISRKKKKNPWFFYIIVITSIILFSYSVYNYKDKIIFQIRRIFLPENIKYAESKLKNLQKELEKELSSEDSNIEAFYKNTEKRKEFLKKIDENIHLFYFFEESSENLKDLYYYLTLSYFFKIITYYDFTKENLLLQISRGMLPDSALSKQNLNLEQGEIISKKFSAIDQDYEKNDSYLISYIAIDFFYKNILSKYLAKLINQVNPNALNLIFKPYYDWFYLTINSNYGNIEKINEFLKSNTFWKFSEEEILLIQGITYYYAKDYYNFFKVFYDYKNKIQQPYHNLSNLQKFIYREFLRLSLESYFLQRNFFLAKILMNELKELATKENDNFTQKRVEFLIKKMK